MEGSKPVSQTLCAHVQGTGSKTETLLPQSRQSAGLSLVGRGAESSLTLVHTEKKICPCKGL